MITLSATTWNHVRGVAPLAAAGQVYADRHDDVSFRVEPHAARVFGEGPLDDLARRFDIIVFDHPMTGHAAERGLFLPLDQFLPGEVLRDRRENSVGGSYDSYVHGGHVWGLPIDAACIACAVREDLLPKPPNDWEQLMALAEQGRVAQPFSRMTATAMYYTLRNTGDDDERAIAKLRQLFAASGGAERLEQGSTSVLEQMAGGSEIALIPACYAYSNYCRAGFCRHPVRFHPTPLAPSGGAVLGGAGVAVSALSRHRDHALRFAQWLSGAECQSTIYACCGGQPAHAAAWDAELPNRLTDGFYRRLRPAMEHAWVRPNAEAFHEEQSRLADRLRQQLVPAGALE